MNYHEITINLAASQIQYTTFKGKRYAVVPAVMSVEGVHHGSGDPVFYPKHVLARSAPEWNGYPVTIGHPTGFDGLPIPAKGDPGIIGVIYHSKMDGAKLKANLYLEKAKLEKKAPTLLEQLMAGKLMDVSTGVFIKDDRVPGVWNGEAYKATVLDIRPDHLAILLHQKGACSWTDGCGIRANQAVNSIDQADYFTWLQKGEINMTAVINETPLSIPEPFYAANSEALTTVKNNIIRQYGVGGLMRLQSMTKAEVEAMAVAITEEASVTRNCNNCGEAPLPFPFMS